MTILSSEKSSTIFNFQKSWQKKIAHTAEIMKSNEILKELPEMQTSKIMLEH